MGHWLVNHIFLPVAHIGLQPGDSDEWRMRKMIAISTVVWTGVPIQIILGILYMTFGESTAGLLIMGYGLLMLLGVFTYQRTRRFWVHNIFWLTITLLSPFTMSLLLGGLAQAGFTFMWAILAPLLSLVTNRPRYVFFWLPAFIVTLLVVLVLQPLFGYTNDLPSWLITTFTIINITSVVTLLVLADYYFVEQNRRLLILLHEEQSKSDNLLLNILPKEIAAILRERSEVIADHYDGVSVLFADVVNFTPLSAKLTPTELVDMLDQVFSGFDTLVDKYGLEKIKTIGDCYMVAAGVPRPRADHANILTELALEMRDYVRQHDFLGLHLSFRMGINSGPVVAGVIGRKKFIYDLWGDAVNTASRMESHGLADVIQITEETFGLIRDSFECEPRGIISVKGKGEMKVWQVLRIKRAATIV